MTGTTTLGRADAVARPVRAGAAPLDSEALAVTRALAVRGQLGIRPEVRATLYAAPNLA